MYPLTDNTFKDMPQVKTHPESIVARAWTLSGSSGLRTFLCYLSVYLSDPPRDVSSYNEARKIKIAQDDFCAKALAGEWSTLSRLSQFTS